MRRGGGRGEERKRKRRKKNANEREKKRKYSRLWPCQRGDGDAEKDGQPLALGAVQTAQQVLGRVPPLAPPPLLGHRVPHSVGPLPPRGNFLPLLLRQPHHRRLHLSLKHRRLFFFVLNPEVNPSLPRLAKLAPWSWCLVLVVLSPGLVSLSSPLPFSPFSSSCCS